MRIYTREQLRIYKTAKGLGKPVKHSVKHFIKMFDDV